MKKKIINAFRRSTVFILISAFIVQNKALAEKTLQDSLSNISAKSSVLICADNGEIIYEKNAHDKMPIASTTKIMTALLAIESAQAKDIDVTITEGMVPVEGSSMYLKVGNILSLSSLAKGMLTVSGNDAANSAAITIGGSIELFADIMNEKAKQIGMNDTHFVNPSGLDDEDHYSTAYDMALLGAYAMENESFYNITSAKKAEVLFKDTNETVTYYNENRMLSRYPGCLGIKTGFTKAAGRCLVTCAQREKLRLIAVTLDAKDDWNDHEKLLNYGFLKMKALTLEEKDEIAINLVGGNVERINVSTKTPLNVIIEQEDKDKIVKVINLPKFIYAPVKKGQIVGKIKYYAGDKLIGENEIIVKNDEPLLKKENFVKKICKYIGNLFKK
ncbi:MAG: D-alanyl-D-alanine carboxypeptidase [Clostridia bacterium]|nr:D-alanyl-D-alanine carboxypeptidase [Clostridia bacterium]